jgi:hypothetical protein
MITYEQAQGHAKTLGEQFKSESWFCGVAVEYDSVRDEYFVSLRGTKDTPDDYRNIATPDFVRIIFEERTRAKVLGVVE